MYHKLRLLNFFEKCRLYPQLVYTKIENDVEGAFWLATQTPNILCYSFEIFAGVKELK